MIITKTTVIKEDILPFSYVEYPNHYGTFIRFSETANGEFYFCMCMKPAIKNLIELQHLFECKNNTDPKRKTKYDSNYFSDIVATKSINNDFSFLQFKEMLCHRCNMVLPKGEYCHEMYGTKLDQILGWYYNQSWLRNGVFYCEGYLKNTCSYKIAESINLINKLRVDINKIHHDEVEIWKTKKKELNSSLTKLNNIFKNITREDFGMKKVGEQWVTETVIYYFVKEIFDGC